MTDFIKLRLSKRNAGIQTAKLNFTVDYRYIEQIVKTFIELQNRLVESTTEEQLRKIENEMKSWASQYPPVNEKEIGRVLFS
jgi:hypothetical protein